METKRLMIEVTATIWADVEVDEGDTLEDAVHRWKRNYDEDMYISEVNFIHEVTE